MGGVTSVPMDTLQFKTAYWIYVRDKEKAQLTLGTVHYNGGIRHTFLLCETPIAQFSLQKLE